MFSNWNLAALELVRLEKSVIISSTRCDVTFFSFCQRLHKIVWSMQEISWRSFLILIIFFFFFLIFVKLKFHRVSYDPYEFHSLKGQKFVNIQNDRHGISCMDHTYLWGLRQKLNKLQPSLEKSKSNQSSNHLTQLTSLERNLLAQNWHRNQLCRLGAFEKWKRFRKCVSTNFPRSGHASDLVLLTHIWTYEYKSPLP